MQTLSYCKFYKKNDFYLLKDTIRLQLSMCGNSNPYEMHKQQHLMIKWYKTINKINWDRSNKLEEKINLDLG